MIDLSRGFAAYLEERRQASRTLVTSTQRKARRLEREVGPLRFDADGTDRAALRRLLAWKSDQYARTGAPDLFGDPGVVRLLEALVDRPSPGCTATVAALYAGDRLVAAHLGLRSPSVLAYWFPAYDPALQAYSPGRVLLLRLAEAAAGRGIATLDLGRGHEQYKQRFASRALQVAEGAVHLPGLVGAAQRAAGLPRRLGLRYVADGPLEPAARRVIDAVRRARQARRPGATAPAGRR